MISTMENISQVTLKGDLGVSSAFELPDSLSFDKI